MITDRPQLMVTAVGLVSEIVWFGAAGRGGRGRSGFCGGGGRANIGEFAGDYGAGHACEGAEGGEAATDDAGGDFGGAAERDVSSV